MAADGAAVGSAAGSKSRASGFEWISPSPSPEEVDRLVSSFPEVVRLPAEDLEAEREAWQSSAIIARSFKRWVPAAALIREFRRAGVQGEITPISLAFKCHIFRFENRMACEMLLSRPWTVNGEVIGMIPWKPEFIPAEDAISTALVWVRLPSLPLEFWKLEFLRMILEPAGSLVCVDASTLAKSRGGFARACIRLDLRQPLRPGTRVQGTSSPFWQQFAYECLEGICSFCGSIHMGGPCALAAGSVDEASDQRPAYGPWIAALRHRRSGPVELRGKSGKPDSRSSTGAAGKGQSPVIPQVERRRGVVDAEGWSTPTKVARRRVPGHGKSDVGNSVVAGSSQGVGNSEAAPGEGLCAGNMNSGDSVAVPGEGLRAGYVISAVNLKGAETQCNVMSELSQPIQLMNPFSSIGSGSDVGGVQVGQDAFPGPLKRPRSDESLVPRSSSKSEKRKGKGKANMTKRPGVLIGSAISLSLTSGFQAGGKVGANPGLEMSDESSQEILSGQMSGLPSGFTQSTMVYSVSDGLTPGSSMTPEGDTLSIGRIPDNAMGEDQGGS